MSHSKGTECSRNRWSAVKWQHKRHRHSIASICGNQNEWDNNNNYSRATVSTYALIRCRELQYNVFFVTTDRHGHKQGHHVRAVKLASNSMHFEAVRNMDKFVVDRIRICNSTETSKFLFSS